MLAYYKLGPLFSRYAQTRRKVDLGIFRQLPVCAPGNCSFSTHTYGALTLPSALALALQAPPLSCVAIAISMRQTAALRVGHGDDVCTTRRRWFQVSPVAKPATLRICACRLDQGDPAQPSVSATVK